MFLKNKGRAREDRLNFAHLMENILDLSFQNGEVFSDHFFLPRGSDAARETKAKIFQVAGIVSLWDDILCVYDLDDNRWMAIHDG